MSGGGGFYKFRCKYFLTYNCPNWVYVNNTACASCSAQGRELEPAQFQAPANMGTVQVQVPHFENGMITYTLIEVDRSYWDLG
ncbi:hypothetical protein F4808DRAFT_434692 [Astrocystis sublimbata]|nr:hypothetical protein F4808DRAFT_434692 [Astrocystis sublimbata]